LESIMNLRDFNPVSLGGNWTEQKAVTQDGRSVLFYRNYPTASTPMLVVFESDDEGWESPLVEEPCATFQEAMSRLRSLTVHGPTQPKCDVFTLAREFQRTVRDCFFHHPTMEWEGADDEPTSAYWQWAKGQQAILAGIDQKNRDGGFDKMIDHLADATDANEYMIEAWDVAARCRLMAGSWVHANLTNDAWQKAKEWGYAMPDPSDLPRPCGDCGRAVAYNFAADDWEHVGNHECFLAGPGQDDAQYAPDPCDSCEDAGCSDHGIDAMPDRWAEPEPVDPTPAKEEARANLLSAMNEAIDGLNILNAQFDLQQVEDIMLDPSVEHFNPLPMDLTKRHPLSELVDAMRTWRDNLRDPSLAWAACAGCEEYVVEAGVSGQFMEGIGDGDEWRCPACHEAQ